MIRTYSSLSELPDFYQRFNYLKLGGRVGEETFGFDRYLNQAFYRSTEWKRTRDYVILRDNGCDLGVSDRPIFGKILVHHMNPITEIDIIHKCVDLLLDPELLVCTSIGTHNAIHYGDETKLETDITVRSPGDTRLW